MIPETYVASTAHTPESLQELVERELMNAGLENHESKRNWLSDNQGQKFAVVAYDIGEKVKVGWYERATALLNLLPEHGPPVADWFEGPDGTMLCRLIIR